MEMFETIQARRSVRRYTSQPVSDETLQRIIQAGLWAPSGLNLQPWHFVAVRSDSKKKELLAIMENVSKDIKGELEERFPDHPELVSDTRNFIKSLGDAPVIMLAFLCRDDYEDKKTAMLSVAAAVENMLIQARSMDVASCWLTAAEQAGYGPVIRDRFAPGKGDLIAIVTLGYTDKWPREIPRKTGRAVVI